MTDPRIAFATNNGDIAGGEVMLFALAEAARELGCDVTVVGPRSPRAVVERAIAEGFRAVEINADTRSAYLRGLRAWDRSTRQGLLWANGLVPGLATAGHRNRVVHLHQVPRNAAQRAILTLAGWGTHRVFAPSHSLAAQVPGTTVLSNWCPPVARAPLARPAEAEPTVVGFLGRLSPGKGIDVLAEAMAILDGTEPGAYRLLAAGDARGVSEPDSARVEAALARVQHITDRPGWMSPEKFFSSVHLAAFPSTFNESFGLVAAEAMSARVPFVISEAGALPEVAGPGHRWTARPGDAVSLAHAIAAARREVTDADLDRAFQRWATEYSPDAGRARLATALTDLEVLPR